MLSGRSYYSLASLEGLNGGLSRKTREAPPGPAPTPQCESAHPQSFAEESNADNFDSSNKRGSRTSLVS